MITIVLEVTLLLLSISVVFSENTQISSPKPVTSKTVAGISIAAKVFTRNKSAQFVNIIKENLRKNNDDYLEPVRIDISNPDLSINKKPITHTIVKGNAGNKLPYKTKIVTVKNDIAFDMKRKQLKPIDNVRRFDVQVPLKRFTGFKKTSSSITKMIDTHKSSAPQRNWKTANKTISLKDVSKYTWREVYPKYVNKEKVNKEKYEAQKMGFKDILMKRPVMHNSRMNLRVSSSREQKLAEKKAREATEIPTGDQLDMAPGKGGRMHAKRLKNYLCHRHVMMPEGPKYDSQGKVYLPAFRDTSGHKYDQTRQPLFLLPKCCNCCKKSVLGCE